MKTKDINDNTNVYYEEIIDFINKDE